MQFKTIQPNIRRWECSNFKFFVTLIFIVQNFQKKMYVYTHVNSIHITNSIYFQVHSLNFSLSKFTQNFIVLYVEQLNQFENWWFLVSVFFIYFIRYIQYTRHPNLKWFSYSTLFTLKNLQHLHGFFVSLYLQVSIKKLCDDNRSYTFWYFIERIFLNLTVHQIYKSNADKINIFLDFRNIYHVLLDHIYFALQLPKASCEFRLCSIFLKIPSLTKVSVYLKPKCYIQVFYN